MPDPVVCLEAVVAAAAVSAIAVLAVSWRRPASTAWLNAACVAGIGLGLAIGNGVLQIPFSWPPASGLDRFLTIVFPAVLAVELAAGLESLPRWLAWLLRTILATVTGRILLHGSVYLKGANCDWQIIVALAVCGALLIGMWYLLTRLYLRRPDVSIALALAQAILCGGVTVMMAGYVRGGEAALPAAAALAAVAVVSPWVAKRPAAEGTIGIGVVALFGLLFIGRCFGELSTGRALAIFLAPLLYWTTELPALRRQKPWISAALGLLAVAIPLIVVLVLAKRDFDREMAPLLALPFMPGAGAESGQRSA